MRNRHSMIPFIIWISAVTFLFLTFFPGYILSAVVTLKHVKFYTAQKKWIEGKPAVHFKCSGENKTSLPHVKKANVLYSFSGKESWQPLTELRTKKCKRCGIYEDHLKSHHIFDEWELCSSDFTGKDGHYTRSKEKEFNAMLLCKGCLSLKADSPRKKEASKSAGGNAFHIVPFLVTVGVILVAVIVSVLVFKYWQRRKRLQQQAKFLKLFEDDDEIEDELGLRDMI